MGYGIDGKVYLRWAEAETKQERSILSGYHIERKLDGESSFTRITDEPVAISHVLDETNTYFQSPVFYEDTVDNGRTAEYRVYSIDVFGRKSRYSDVYSLQVQKVTPPNAPSADTSLITRNMELKNNNIGITTENPAADGQISHIIEIVDELYPNKRGVALSVFTDSPDTVRFTIYRAEAIGAKGFGQPVAIANLEYNNPEAAASNGAQPENLMAIQPDGEPGLLNINFYQTTVTRTGLLKGLNMHSLKYLFPHIRILFILIPTSGMVVHINIGFRLGTRGITKAPGLRPLR